MNNANALNPNSPAPAKQDLNTSPRGTLAHVRGSYEASDIYALTEAVLERHGVTLTLLGGAETGVVLRCADYRLVLRYPFSLDDWTEAVDEILQATADVPPCIDPC